MEKTEKLTFEQRSEGDEEGAGTILRRKYQAKSTASAKGPEVGTALRNSEEASVAGMVRKGERGRKGQGGVGQSTWHLSTWEGLCLFL